MFKKVIISLGAAVILSACSALGGNVPTELQQSNKNLVKNYVAATTYVLQGQMDIAKALDIKENFVDDLDRQIKSLQSGNLTTGDIEKNTELSESVNTVLTKRLAEQKTLSKEAKIQAAKGLGNYSMGVLFTSRLAKEASNFISSTQHALGTASVIDKAAIVDNLSVGTAVAQKTPSLSKDLVETGNKFISFAKSSGVNVTEAQKNMSQAAGF